MSRRREFLAALLWLLVAGVGIGFGGGWLMRELREGAGDKVLVCDYAPLGAYAEIPRPSSKRQRMWEVELDAAYDTALAAGATICFNYGVRK